MGKFVNPKNLKGQDKLNRIKDLMGRMNTLNESKSFSELELIKKGPNNIVYGIIRENHNYFIKTTEKTHGTFLSEDFKYVGGLQNKYDERYSSYAEALKHLNLKFDMLNESFGIKKNTNIFESDGIPTANASGVSEMQGGLGFVMENPEEDHPDQSCWDAHEKDQKSHEEWKDEQNEELTNPDLEVEKPDGEVEQLLDEDDIEEQKKSVIKVDAPAAPAPAPVEDEVEVDEFGGAGDDEFGAEEEIDVEIDEDDPTKKIQKLTGKVAQLMRDMEEPDGELDKYVINSIISAIDWEEIGDDDVEDIIAKIEGEDEEDGEVDVEIDAEEGGEVEEFGAEEEITEDSEAKETYDYGEDEGADEKKIKRLRKKKQTGDVKSHEKALGYDEEYDEDREDRREKGTSFAEQRRVFSKKQLMESFLKKKH